MMSNGNSKPPDDSITSVFMLQRDIYLSLSKKIDDINEKLSDLPSLQNDIKDLKEEIAKIQTNLQSSSNIQDEQKIKIDELTTLKEHTNELKEKLDNESITKKAELEVLKKMVFDQDNKMNTAEKCIGDLIARINDLTTGVINFVNQQRASSMGLEEIEADCRANTQIIYSLISETDSKLEDLELEKLNLKY